MKWPQKEGIVAIPHKGMAIDAEILGYEEDLINKKRRLASTMKCVERMLTKIEDIIDNSKILVFMDYTIEEYSKIHNIQLTFQIINFGTTKSVSKYLSILEDFQDLLTHGGVCTPIKQAHLDYTKEEERLRRAAKKLKKECLSKVSSVVKDPTTRLKFEPKDIVDNRVKFEPIIFTEAIFNIIGPSESKSLKLSEEFLKRKAELEKATRLDHKRTKYEKKITRTTPPFSVIFKDQAFYLSDVLRNAATKYHSVAKAKDRDAFDEVDSILNAGKTKSIIEPGEIGAENGSFFYATEEDFRGPF